MSIRSPTSQKNQENRYRSWGETQIARMLNRYGLPFRYEHPLAVIDRGKTRIWYPDFQLPGYGIVIEYCGRPHDPQYAEGMDRKRAVYEGSGVNALMYSPDLFRGDWPRRILGEIEKVLIDRTRSFREAMQRKPRDARANGPEYMWSLRVGG